MSENSTSASRPFGAPFWMGYAVSTVAWLVLVFGHQTLGDSLGFWLSAWMTCIALGVVGPFAGVLSQAAHDFVVAVCRRQVRLMHVALLLAIVLVSLLLGYINYWYGGDGEWYFW